MLATLSEKNSKFIIPMEANYNIDEHGNPGQTGFDIDL